MRRSRAHRVRGRARRSLGTLALVTACLATTCAPSPAADRDHSGTAVRPCATTPYPPSQNPPAPILSGPDVWEFVTAPGLRPMRVQVTTRKPGTARGGILVGPFSADQMVGQTGALINDDSGDPVWFRPLPSVTLQNADLRVQTYRGPRGRREQPVLTWWQGSIALPPYYTNLPAGAPEPGGCYYIVDSHYRLLRTVFARHGYYPDEHEFTLTRRGTALFIASRPVPMDLTPYGGPADGAILNSEVQEVDLATGKLVYSWNALDHLDPADSEEPVSSASQSDGVWDAFHINSVDEGPKDQLLISARNMWAIYDVATKSNRTRWQLGGMKSDFTFGPNADFYWQHDARFRPGSRISMFDDGCCDLPDGTPEQESHGLILNLDFRHWKATVSRTYYHEPPLEVPTQGNLQSLPNGNKFIGWGQSPYYSEYRNAGNTQGNGSHNLLYDARMPGSNISYRVYRNEWVGTPYYPPSAAALAMGGQTTVYASWNGSTETRAWQVLAGPRPRSLSVVVRRTARTGFETSVLTNAQGPYFQVRALDRKGRVLRASKVVKRS
ncbi:arylsulfotransferase family protein [Streptomyces sp. NPDC047022]|uniref:arylsulfotransferase family protein n=1 Tax=Streptomyces sp. NPDC047022 TaxID=3155737 RepID=UPI0033C04827